LMPCSFWLNNISSVGCFPEIGHWVGKWAAVVMFLQWNLYVFFIAWISLLLSISALQQVPSMVLMSTSWQENSCLFNARKDNWWLLFYRASWILNLFFVLKKNLHFILHFPMNNV
jgi:hypothetical protein